MRRAEWNPQLSLGNLLVSVWAIVLCMILVSLPLVGCQKYPEVVPKWFAAELVLPSYDVSSDIIVLFSSVFYEQWLFVCMLVFLLLPTLGFFYILWRHDWFIPGVKTTREVTNKFVFYFTLTPWLFDTSDNDCLKKLPRHMPVGFKPEKIDEDDWWANEVTFTIRTFAGNKFQELSVPLGSNTRKFHFAIAMLVLRIIASLVYCALWLGVIFVYVAYFWWCACIIFLSPAFGAVFFFIKTTLILIGGLLLFQTKLFPIPRVQREWHRLWADEDVEEVKGNWRDELKDGASVEAQRDDDTWVMTRIESVAADVLGLVVVGSDDDVPRTGLAKKFGFGKTEEEKAPEELSRPRESERLARPGTHTGQVNVGDFNRSLLIEILCESAPMLAVQSYNWHHMKGGFFDILSICFSALLAVRTLWNIAVPYYFHGKKLEDIAIGGTLCICGGDFEKTYHGKQCLVKQRTEGDDFFRKKRESKVAPDATPPGGG